MDNNILQELKINIAEIRTNAGEIAPVYLTDDELSLLLEGERPFSKSEGLMPHNQSRLRIEGDWGVCPDVGTGYRYPARNLTTTT